MSATPTEIAPLGGAGLKDAMHAGPLVAKGRGKRTLPFLIALIGVFVFAPLGGDKFSAVELGASIILAVLLIALAAFVPWRSFPVSAQAIIPFGFFIDNMLLRDATGAANSGVSIILLIALWVALYGSRLQVGLVVLGIFATYEIPLLIFPHSHYPDSVLEIRRAVTTVALTGLMAWTVHRVVANFRESQSDLATALDREHEVVAQLRDLDRMKSRFVAMASHELRTPLTSVSGFASTLVKRWDAVSDDERREFAQIIDDQSSRLHRLVDNLLVLTRIQSGSVNVAPKPVQVNEAIRRVIELLGAAEVEVICSDDIEAFVDGEHFQQILINYVTNALKYGSLPITIKALRADSMWIDVRVSDSGGGVPPDFVPHLFREFEREPTVEQLGIEGTGLGLSIAAGLARAQGGEVWYEHNLPHGAVFVVRLPATGQ